jgi:hypothetical protein
MKPQKSEANEYEMAFELARMLEAQGIRRMAETLVTDVRGGATSTEILANLRFHIRQFLALPGHASGQAIELAHDLYTRIEAKLD